MKLGALSHYLGWLVSILGLAQIPALAYALWYQEPDIYAFLFSISIALTFGILMVRYSDRESQLSVKQSFLLVALSWVAAALFGSLPFAISGYFDGYLNAFFESMSGFTTTGATILDDIEILPHGLLFWRSFTHWLGGMGIIVLFIAMFSSMGSKSINLFSAESPGPAPDRLVPRIANTAKILWLIYTGISVLQVLLLLISGLSLFESLTHTFATMGTGGFSTRNASIGGLGNPMAEVVITIFMFIAGGNFALYFLVSKGSIKALITDEEFRFYLIVVFLAIFFVSLNLYVSNMGDGLTTLRKGAFQSVSIITTTGFGTANFDAWPALSRNLLFFLLFFGGCGGSTAGAMKQIRLLVLLKYSYRELFKQIHPKAMMPIRFNKKIVPESVVTSILGFVCLYIVMLTFATLALSSLGLDLESALSAVAATIGNVGPGLGLIGPTQTYNAIPALGKMILCFMMLLGRLEIYTVLVLFIPDHRRRNRKKVKPSLYDRVLDNRLDVP